MIGQGQQVYQCERLGAARASADARAAIAAYRVTSPLGTAFPTFNPICLGVFHAALRRHVR